MIQNVVTSIILYSGTAVDLLIILMLFFAKRKSRKDIINIYLGQFLGSVSLILLSLLFAFVLDYIPSKEILGLLGLIPIFLGIKVLLLGDSDGEAIAKEGLRKDNKNLIFLVAMITFASCGADNIGVFIPYFTTLNLANLIVALLTFLVMIYLLVFSAQKLAQVPSVGETLEKYSRWFVAVVYLGLGVYILIENNSFDMLWTVSGQEKIL
ncbi:TPA: CadD family cadmium resistance transporter [Neisseria meningitidis]|uniref:CadD family cadmium resistance transporter n=1 Tax=Neisseria meningitidis TaxID=487 RepID=UPI0002A4FCAA|nr:CadD family cadmium resistance transporter [Neisseria meningitidis]ELK63584.1 cadmium resistance transporter family protein [Neisseria meningitidis 97021]ELK70471.1 cadmium resistance transporter family protein [Neisseria meningitidis 2006087]ELK75422.1 cadmium resistance transporter family protein [Neisseria meningitidis 2002038]ELK76370.1 cadmium resistance transporter family protein [Neisseria meningitidis 97014]EOC49273.1 cadmium resistance transporter family protein [Neisseria meningit